MTSFDQVKTMKKRMPLRQDYRSSEKEIDDRYMEELKKQSIHPEVIKEMAKDIKLYTHRSTEPATFRCRVLKAWI